jgi:hypothetical protein
MSRTCASPRTRKRSESSHPCAGRLATPLLWKPEYKDLPVQSKAASLGWPAGGYIHPGRQSLLQGVHHGN